MVTLSALFQQEIRNWSQLYRFSWCCGWRSFWKGSRCTWKWRRWRTGGIVVEVATSLYIDEQKEEEESSNYTAKWELLLLCSWSTSTCALWLWLKCGSCMANTVSNEVVNSPQVRRSSLSEASELNRHGINVLRGWKRNSSKRHLQAPLLLDRWM